MLRPIMARSEEGLKNEALQKALQEALGGVSLRLEELLARHGALPSGRPNLTLAAAFGIEIGAYAGSVTKLLERLGAEDAAPDTPRVFLPVAAAHGWVARIREGKDVEAAWYALAELAADERTQVRLGTLDALVSLAVRPGCADILVARVEEWLARDDREVRFGAAALAVEALGEPRVIAGVEAPEALLAYLTRAIDVVADAPRSAERSEGRRRMLLSFPRTLSSVASGLRAGELGLRWLIAECERAEHPDVRRALGLSAEHLRTSGRSQGPQGVEQLRKALEESAKPLRDPSRVRPGTGRGKQSRKPR
jgi:hypothetical protein